jgi:hypothetical protein
MLSTSKAIERAPVDITLNGEMSRLLPREADRQLLNGPKPFDAERGGALNVWSSSSACHARIEDDVHDDLEGNGSVSNCSPTC